MPAADVVTLGFGSFAASPLLVITLGFSIGAAAASVVGPVSPSDAARDVITVLEAPLNIITVLDSPSNIITVFERLTEP